MTSVSRHPSGREGRHLSDSDPRPRMPWRTTALGGFFLMTGGIHIGILSADAGSYASFADQALFGFVRDGWDSVFMAHPRFWALLVALGEASIGTLLLTGRRTARAGWCLAILFHVVLMLFGFGFWLYALPALGILFLGARHDWPHLGEGDDGGATEVRPQRPARGR
jgi:hypothetical protein